MPATVARLGAFTLAALLGAGAALSVGFALDQDESDTQPAVTVDSADTTTPPRFTATGGGGMSIQEIYETRGPGVVQVISAADAFDDPFRRAGAAAQGSGFVIDKAGHVVTNYHVVEGSEDVAGRTSRARTAWRRSSSASILRPTSPSSRSTRGTGP